MCKPLASCSLRQPRLCTLFHILIWNESLFLTRNYKLKANRFPNSSQRVLTLLRCRVDCYCISQGIFYTQVCSRFVELWWVVRNCCGWCKRGDWKRTNLKVKSIVTQHSCRSIKFSFWKILDLMSFIVELFNNISYHLSVHLNILRLVRSNAAYQSNPLSA